MIFNDGMTIWILAILLMVIVALTGWKQGAIQAAFSFVSIIVAALLAPLVGRVFHPLLPHLGVTDPITVWAVAPLLGFLFAIIPLKVLGYRVHNRAEHYYRYRAGDLRMMLWTRLNARLGICVGLLNGALYFILASFFIFNIAYWTTQTVSAAATPPLTTRLINALGKDMHATGFSQTATAVGTLPPAYYRLADFCGLLMQNPQLAGRLVDYPGLVSLWQRDDLQGVLGQLTNAPAAGATLGDVVNSDPMQGLMANKELSQLVESTITTNLNDLTMYLTTGQTAKYAGEPILGNWVFNASVTLAWLRQNEPKMAANDMVAVRSLWGQAYGQTKFLFAGDGQIFVKGFPKFVTAHQANEPPFQAGDGRGDWMREGKNYTLHITANGDEKYLSCTTDGTRMNVKDGRNLLIFDHVY